VHDDEHWRLGFAGRIENVAAHVGEFLDLGLAEGARFVEMIEH
jgi:hypothetical protein